jgi:hypothetical protein
MADQNDSFGIEALRRLGILPAVDYQMNGQAPSLGQGTGGQIVSMGEGTGGVMTPLGNGNTAEAGNPTKQPANASGNPMQPPSEPRSMAIPGQSREATQYTNTAQLGATPSPDEVTARAQRMQVEQEQARREGGSFGGLDLSQWGLKGYNSAELQGRRQADEALAEAARQKQAQLQRDQAMKYIAMTAPQTYAQMTQAQQASNTPLLPGQQRTTDLSTGKTSLTTHGPALPSPQGTAMNADEILAKKLGYDLRHQVKSDGTPMQQQDFEMIDAEREASAKRISAARSTGTVTGKAAPEALAAAQAYADAVKKGQAQTLPPEHVDALAEAFLTPGSPMYQKQPNMGFGAAGMPARLQFLDAVADKMKQQGFTATDTSTRSALLKGYQTELTSQQGQRGKIDPFIRTTMANIDQAMSLFPKVGNGGVPVWNKWVNRFRAEYQGDPDVASLNAVIDSAMAEYAKVVTSATGSGVTGQAEREKWESRFNSAMTDAQAMAVAKNLKQELGNRLRSYDESQARIVQNIQELGGGAPAQPRSAIEEAAPNVNAAIKGLQRANPNEQIKYDSAGRAYVNRNGQVIEVQP